MACNKTKNFNLRHFIVVSFIIVFASTTLIGTANAGTVTYDLNGVALSDGSNLTGSFTIDWDANLGVIPVVTNAFIEHTGGNTNSTGAYITYDPVLGITYPDPVNFGVSGQTLAGTFDLSSSIYTETVVSLVQYTGWNHCASIYTCNTPSGLADNIWTLTLKTQVDTSVWQFLHIDFNPDTKELFLDQWVTDALGTKYFLLGTRLYQTDGIWTTAVPVPAAAWLFGSGLLGLLGISRKRKAA